MNHLQTDSRRLRDDFEKVLAVLERAKRVDPFRRIEKAEFVERARKVDAALRENGLEMGLVFSDAHYCGDVPYLGGNTNITVEQVAGLVGAAGFHLLAGLEGGYVAEQLAGRAGVAVHKVELLQLADEHYPVRAERLEDVVRQAGGGRVPERLALLTPRQVLPVSLLDECRKIFGDRIVDAQEIYQRVKYEKSPAELALVEDAAAIADAVMEAMLAVLKPGMLETQVAAWGYFAARELGAEELGFDIMVGANDANRTLIGKALNREIRLGDWVHLGIGAKRDGLNACIRRSVIAAPSPDAVAPERKYWFDLVEGAYEVGYRAYCDVARSGAPARAQEQALVDYFAARSAEVSAKVGRPVRLETLKPYTGTHNSGYTECQEFFGAITLDSNEPLGENVVTMLDVALRGFGDHWHDVVIPGFDFLVVENTLVKRGEAVKNCQRLPVNVQSLVSF